MRILSFETFNERLTRAEWLPEPLLLELRRRAVRNMRKAGVSESIAGKIGGHKTANVFRRYDIVDTSRVSAARAAVEQINCPTNTRAKSPEKGSSLAELRRGSPVGGCRPVAQLVRALP